MMGCCHSVPTSLDRGQHLKSASGRTSEDQAGLAVTSGCSSDVKVDAKQVAVNNTSDDSGDDVVNDTAPANEGSDDDDTSSRSSDDVTDETAEDPTEEEETAPGGTESKSSSEESKSIIEESIGVKTGTTVVKTAHVTEKSTGGVPPLSPPTRKKTDLIPDNTIFAELDKHVRNTPKSAASSVEKLALYLTSKCRTDLEKIRVVFCWLAYNIAYDTGSYFSGKPGPTGGTASTLQSGLAMCQGYSDLFEDLCKLAISLSLSDRSRLREVYFAKLAARNLSTTFSVKRLREVDFRLKVVDVPCKHVSGIAKGFSHGPEQVYTVDSETNHAWNLVLVGGEWRPLDSTWGAGHIEKGGTFTREFDEHWFLTDPEEFAPKHFPLMDKNLEESSKYQLLERPYTIEEFSASVPLTSHAYNLGLKLITHKQTIIDVDCDVTIKVKATRKLLESVSVTLTQRRSNQKVEGRVLTSLGEDGTCSIYVRPPHVATYALGVMGQGHGEEDKDTLHQLLAYGYVIRCKKTHPIKEPFPDMSDLWGLQTPIAWECGLKRVKDMPFQYNAKNGQVKVTLPLSRSTDLSTTLKHARDMDEALEEFTIVECSQDGARVTARLPKPGYYILNVFASHPEEDDLQHVADFLLYADKECPDQEPYPVGSTVLGLKNPAATECGLKPVRDMTFTFLAKDGQVKVSLSLSRFTELSTALRHARDMDGDLEQFTFVEYTEDGATISVRLPEPGYYGLQVFASHPKQSKLQSVAKFLLYADKGRGQCQPFPRVFQSEYYQKARLLQPLVRAVPSGEATLYRVYAPSLGKVKVGDTKMEMKNDGVWEAEVTPQKDAKDVTIYAAEDKDATSLKGLYKFTVT